MLAPPPAKNGGRVDLTPTLVKRIQHAESLLILESTFFER